MTDGTEAHAECNNCGASLDPSHGGPCPSCGELDWKDIRVRVRSAVLVTDAASATVIEWWEQRYKVLLDTARELRAHDHPEAAIVMAQTACEVCTGAVLSEALRASGVERLKDPIDNLLPSYNLGNDRLRKLYVAVSGDRIHEERFWAAFKEHTTRRQRVVHRGEEAIIQEAEESIAAVDKVIQHLLKNRS